MEVIRGQEVDKQLAIDDFLVRQAELPAKFGIDIREIPCRDAGRDTDSACQFLIAQRPVVLHDGAHEPINQSPLERRERLDKFAPTRLSLDIRLAYLDVEIAEWVIAGEERHDAGVNRAEGEDRDGNEARIIR